jgi:signal transduction histidine kinase
VKPITRSEGRSSVGERPSVETTWEQRSVALNATIAYWLLAIPTVLLLLWPGVALEGRLAIAGLAALAAVWVYLLFTRCPRPWQAHPVRMAIYLVGFLAISVVLMHVSAIFLIFAIAGFFHASLLRPWPVSILGVFLTSISIHLSVTGFPWPTPELWVLFIAIIVIQTVAIGFGGLVGERLAESSEERRQAVVRLEHALDENADLHRQLVEQAREAGVLDERGRMAREIHDTIAHGLTGVVTQLEAAQQAGERADDRNRHIDNAARLARESLAEARRSLEAARPEALESSSLPEALASVARSWSAMNDIPVEVTTTGEAVPLHPEIESALLRTAQEALANVEKHAGASRVGVTLSFMGDVVALDVRDDGVGFEVSEGRVRSGSGFGLTAMRQRVSRVAGTLAIESEPGGGTAVSARVPAIGAQPT